MITITPTPGSVAAAEAMFDRIRDTVDRMGPIVIDAAMEFAHNVILDIFRGEGYSGIVGSRPWAPLAPRTRAERVRLDFPAEHPILYRTGSLLDALVDEGSPMHVIEMNQIGPGHWQGKMGTTDPRFEELQMGVEDRNLPARPMWPVGDSEAQFVRNLEEHLIKVIEQNA